MATENGRTSAGLSEHLLGEAHRFDFFQAVRLLERLRHERARQDPRWRRLPVGRDSPPGRESVRFRAVPSLSFPASEVGAIRQPRPREPVPDWELPPPEMSVSFLGLTGPGGVLPYHYTATLMRRLRDKDHSLRDFLDLFNHRLVSLFYRAWEKYRLPLAYERSRLDEDDIGADSCTRALFSLVGLGTAGLRGRLEIDDQAFLYYGGHFAHYPRSAGVLEGLLEDYFELPIRVHQAQGQWLHLEIEDRARLPAPRRRLACNNQLGVDLVIGARVRDVQSKFRLCVGPLTYAQFRDLMPTGRALRQLCQMTRTYVGPELDFDVQPVLQPDEVPWCRLSAGTDGAYLGWNTWLRCRPFTKNVAGPTFLIETSQ